MHSSSGKFIHWPSRKTETITVEHRQRLKRKPMTDLQRKHFEFIKDQIERGKYPPTMIEIADHFGSSPRNSWEHVSALVRKGWIARVPGRSRGLSIVEEFV